MRCNLVIYLAVAFLSGCAYQGTIVEKRFRPLPFSASLGVDAMYNFQLRDNTQQIHSQMVTPDVFASYRTGDYFNDLQSPPAHDDKELEGFRLPPQEMGEGPYQPVRVMQMRAPQQGANVALHSYERMDSEAKIPRWQTVRIVPIQARERIVAKIVLHTQGQVESGVRIPRGQTARIAADPPQKAAAKLAIHAPSHVENGVRIPRWQSVKITQAQSLEMAAAKVALHTPDHVANTVKIPRWQTVRIVPVQSPETVAAKVALHAAGHIENSMKIPRWQTVRLIPIPSERTAAKIANPASRPTRSAGKTAALPDRSKQSAKIADNKKKRAKVVSKAHRKTVASLN